MINYKKYMKWLFNLFTFNTIIPNPVYMYDCNDIVLDDNGNVIMLRDLSGNGNHLYQPNKNKRPKLINI